eukprot:TRINITY_DN69207_c0_g1_i1.p1 TRINITY_DN69207_c0_g1~~TRINITY_DN69207_c0_g1_i1.p1  ORF type:complete len:282 (-),score=52.82 TRINITY_DN69207_c0_g1_i1:12-797(-)
MAGLPDYFIFGLGNAEALAPADSRHNFGAIFVNFLANAMLEFQQRPPPPVFHRVAAIGADVLDTTLPVAPPPKAPPGTPARALRVVLVKPLCAMNDSGPAVRRVLEWYLRGAAGAGQAAQIPTEVVRRCLVCCDDLNSLPGALAIQDGGDLRSLAGHKGVESIAEALGTTNFVRFRLGIGRPPDGVLVTEFVLGRLGGRDGADRKEVDLAGHCLRTATEALQFFAATGDLKAARKKYQSPKLPNVLKPMNSLIFPVRLEHH